MKISTQRLIDRWLGQVLCGLVSVWWRWRRRWAPTERPHPHRPLRVLVILLSEMGSVVLAGPMFDALKKRHPGMELHVLQLHKNQSVMQVLGFVPHTHLHSIHDTSLVGLLWSVWRTVRTLRQLGLDGVIDCELFSRISALLSYACAARVRVGFTPHTQEGLYRGSFINTPVPYNPYVHISQQFLGLAQALSAALPLSDFELNTVASQRPLNRFPIALAPTQLPPVEVGALELQAFEHRLQQDFAVVGHKPLVLLYVSGGALPIRAWPETHYIALAQALLAQGYAIGLIGLPEDKPQALRVKAHCQDAACIDLTGYTKHLRELLLLFHCADLLITNDGGPGHFASLTPIDCIVFFGPETRLLYGPIHPRFTVLQGQTACAPCLTAYNHRDSFCDGDNQCLKQIDVAHVLQVALTKLRLVREATPTPTPTPAP